MSLIVSTSRLSNWTTTRPGIVARSSGAMSISGACVMSIPPTWMERWRGRPSIRAHSSSQRSQGESPIVEPRGRGGIGSSSMPPMLEAMIRRSAASAGSGAEPRRVLAVRPRRSEPLRPLCGQQHSPCPGRSRPPIVRGEPGGDAARLGATGWPPAGAPSAPDGPCRRASGTLDRAGSAARLPRKAGRSAPRRVLARQRGGARPVRSPARASRPEPSSPRPAPDPDREADRPGVASSPIESTKPSACARSWATRRPPSATPPRPPRATAALRRDRGRHRTGQAASRGRRRSRHRSTQLACETPRPVAGPRPPAPGRTRRSRPPPPGRAAPSPSRTSRAPWPPDRPAAAGSPAHSPPRARPSVPGR